MSSADRGSGLHLAQCLGGRIRAPRRHTRHLNGRRRHLGGSRLTRPDAQVPGKLQAKSLNQAHTCPVRYRDVCPEN
ncbi:hypothetical protein NDU88_006323 [Pleurodeles waltl]|uniref:Uncharacterized protein n=1 Tax=Pleurodeles waltl TaxID=8319 RepID=A0AAV7MYV3_PLEWA|nr:hypothetical protein NDU88_006323 [Pleurodeles waltl]